MSSSGPGSNNDDAPLPPGWTRQFSNSQKRYFYFHKETRHTQWHFPTASEAKDPLKAKKRAEMNHSQQGGSSSSSSHKKHRSHSDDGPAAKRARASKSSQDVDDFLDLADATSVAIIVPFRDIHAAQQRAKHLRAFVPHMHKFFGKLKGKGLVSDYHLYIVEQSEDERKFNRGKLLNIGFDLACKHHLVGNSNSAGKKKKSHPPHDVFIFHDVDLLPSDDLGPWYAKFPTQPLHIARVWDRYSNNPKYFGGVVSFSKSDYRRINGYPNTFWGWGGEDDEMQKRLERLGIVFEAPTSGSLRDLEQMDLKEKLAFLRKNREWKCMVKWEALEEHEKTWKTNGISNLQYKVLETNALDDRASKITVDVQLNGDHWANDKAGIHYMGE